MGLAVLAKGLIGLVFPLLTLGTYAFVRHRGGGGTAARSGAGPRGWARPLRLPLGRGFMLFALVAAPWHVAIALRTPGWAWFYFVNEHILRFLNLRTPRDYGTVPLAAFWLLHFVWLFPWSVYVPQVIADLRSGCRERGLGKQG